MSSWDQDRRTEGYPSATQTLGYLTTSSLPRGRDPKVVDGR